MLREANNLSLRLWRDESGVVLAMTVVVFLTLFLIACSVYAVGETVRQRIEVQNAADAGAYSGALVQADAMSRLGAINRAMVWTYAQMIKREMDQIVDVWLLEAYPKWLIDRLISDIINSMGCCTGHPFWGTGLPGYYEHMLLNKHIVVSGDQVLQAIIGYSLKRAVNKAKIKSAHETIRAMNDAERDIINQLPSRIELAVEAVLKLDIASSWNDTLSPATRADVMYTLQHSSNPMGDYITIETAEPEFFSLADIADHVAYLGDGFDIWYKKKAGSGGMLHGYEETSDHLVAEWYNWSFLGIEIMGVCIPIRVIHEKADENEVWASDAKTGSNSSGDNNIWETEEAFVHKLTPAFFGKKGTIVVGVARRMNNPFQFFSPNKPPAERSVYNAFTLDNDNRFMWGAAAARAGYRFVAGPPSPVTNADGDYQVSYWHDPDKGAPNGFLDDIPHWDIKWSDWDAVMLPLRRAWSDCENGEWKGGPTAAQIMSSVQGGPWVALDGGGGALGSQAAPPMIMRNAGAVINYGSTEDFIFH